MSASVLEIEKVPMAAHDNPFHWGPLRDCWLAHLAEKAQVVERHGDFVVHAKPAAMGLVTFNEMKLFAGDMAWFHDFGRRQLADFKACKDKMSWDTFYTVWADSRKELQCFDQLASEGYTILESPMEPMHVVDISGGYDAYLAGKTSKERYNVRQKIKNALKQNARLVSCETEDEIKPFFREFFKYHIPYWKLRTGVSLYDNFSEQVFTMDWARALHEAGKLRLHRLLINDEAANLSMSFVEGDTLYWLLTINTGAHRGLFPGIVSLNMRIEEACREGIQTFNMGPTEMEYKIHARTHTEARHVRVVINPDSLKGRLYAEWFKARNGG